LIYHTRTWSGCNWWRWSYHFISFTIRIFLFEKMLFKLDYKPGVSGREPCDLWRRSASPLPGRCLRERDCFAATSTAAAVSRVDVAYTHTHRQHHNNRNCFEKRNVLWANESGATWFVPRFWERERATWRCLRAHLPPTIAVRPCRRQSTTTPPLALLWRLSMILAFVPNFHKKIYKNRIFLKKTKLICLHQ